MNDQNKKYYAVDDYIADLKNQLEASQALVSSLQTQIEGFKEVDLTEAFIKKLKDPDLPKDYAIGDFLEEMKVPEKQRSGSAIATLLYQLGRDYNLRIKDFDLKVLKFMTQVNLLPFVYFFEITSDSGIDKNE